MEFEVTNIVRFSPEEIADKLSKAYVDDQATFLYEFCRKIAKQDKDSSSSIRSSTLLNFMLSDETKEIMRRMCAK